MILYPVLDLKGGIVVRGQGGDRANYKAVESVLVDSADPLEVARAIREELGLEHLYVADLDSIGGAPFSSATITALRAMGFTLLVDAGVRSAEEAVAVAAAGADGVIAALETLPDPASLAEVVRVMGPDRVVFSLDLKDGRLLCDGQGWPFLDPLRVAREAVECGVRRLLVLDLAQVGSGRGPGCIDLLRRIAGDVSGIELLSGGGVRSALDLDAFAEAGVHGVLVASALHDGSITRSQIERFSG